jgi:S1-C subfamily serine protease
MRLANYNLAVTLVRGGDRSRALVVLNQLLTDGRPLDEVLLNAQRVVLVDLDEKARASIPAMPTFLKTVASANKVLAALHSPLQRWGVEWMSAEQFKAHQAAGDKEPLPKELPFLLPGDLVLPELGKKVAGEVVNPLAPIDATKAALAANDADPANAPDVKVPDVKSTETKPADVKATDVKPTETKAETKPAVPVPAPAPSPAPRIPAPAPVVATAHAVHGAAFAVAPDLLLTCSRLVAGAKSIDIESTDGITFHAKLIASDNALGVALLKVEGGHFTAMALGQQIHGGAVQVAAFARPGIFAPSLDLLAGQLAAADKQFFLQTATHPRSAGSPIVDDSGKVVALVTATRDDPVNHLPVAAVEGMRKFAAGKFTSVDVTPATANPGQCVFELSATRDEK